MRCATIVVVIIVISAAVC